MKKELHRYYLTAYRGTREKVVQTKQEYSDILKKIELYNKRKYSPVFFGNVTCTSKKDGLHVVAHIYDKLTEASTISELIEYTSKYSKEELTTILRDDTGTKEGYIPDFNIAYFENRDEGVKEKIHYDRRIKYLPVVYKEDRKYLSKEYINKCLEFHASQNDFDFFKGLAYEVSLTHAVADEVEALFQLVDKCQNQNFSTNQMLIVAKKLVNKYIVEREKDGTAMRDEKGEFVISKRRLLDIGMYVKYSESMNKKHSPVVYNESATREEKQKQKKLMKLNTEEYEQMSLF